MLDNRYAVPVCVPTFQDGDVVLLPHSDFSVASWRATLMARRRILPMSGVHGDGTQGRGEGENPFA